MKVLVDIKKRQKWFSTKYTSTRSYHQHFEKEYNERIKSQGYIEIVPDDDDDYHWINDPISQKFYVIPADVISQVFTKDTHPEYFL